MFRGGFQKSVHLSTKLSGWCRELDIANTPKRASALGTHQTRCNKLGLGGSRSSSSEGRFDESAVGQRFPKVQGHGEPRTVVFVAKASICGVL